MKCFLICILTALLLTGCSSFPQTQNEAPVIPTEHMDHHAAQTRKARNFFLEEVDGEISYLYLSYNEPDGCVTRLCEVTQNPHWDRLEPQLFEQGDAFYYTVYVSYNSSTVESDGYLYRIDFAGKKTSLKAPDGFTLGHIISTDESYVYCSADDSEGCLRADLALTGWEETTKEAAQEQ